MSNKRKKIAASDNADLASRAAAAEDGEGSTYTPTQIAGYISYLLDELRVMAEKGEMPFLAYLLNIAYEEAESQKLRKY